MRAGLRLGVIAVAGLALGGAPLLAQEAPPETTTNTPAADSIGPRELQNFNLQGTVTQRPQQAEPAPVAPAPRARVTTATTVQPTDQPTSTPTPSPRVQASTEAGNEAPRAAATEARSTPAPTRSAPSPSGTVNLPAPSGSSTAVAGGADVSTPSETTAAGETGPAPASLAPQHSLSLLPWLLAAIALGAGGAFLFWRNRTREAYAGGAQFDAYVAPEPEPAPRPAPAPAPPPRAAPPTPVGIVSTRLRPWLELNFEPIRCVVDEEKVTFEFELGLFNSGNAPARDVLIEATLFNAGPGQEREIEAFFAKPVGQGQRIAAIPPLQRMNLRTAVSAPRSGLQLFEIGGRHVIVPLIGFNALYRWGVSDGQTSQSFLLGRDTNSEKLAPFRMDLGPRVFRGLAARPLPQFVRN